MGRAEEEEGGGGVMLSLSFRLSKLLSVKSSLGISALPHAYVVCSIPVDVYTCRL